MVGFLKPFMVLFLVWAMFIGSSTSSRALEEGENAKPILFGKQVPGETTANQIEAADIFKQILFDIERRYESETGARCSRSDIAVIDTRIVPNDHGVRTEQWTVSVCELEYPYAVGMLGGGGRAIVTAQYGTFES